METQHSNIYGIQKNPKDEVHSDKGLLHETRKIINTQSKHTFKETRETGKC